MRLPREIGPIHFVGIGGIGMSGIAEVLCNHYGHHPVEIAAVLKAARRNPPTARSLPWCSRIASPACNRCSRNSVPVQRCRRGCCRRGLSGRGGADRRDRPRSFRARTARAWPSRGYPAAEFGGAGQSRARYRGFRRPRRVPGGRQHHAMGLRVARRTEGVGLAVSFPDLLPDIKARMPQLRGRVNRQRHAG